VACFFSERQSTWLSFDDSNVSVVGPEWNDAVVHCERSKYQPLVLFYETMAPGFTMPEGRGRLHTEARAPAAEEIPKLFEVGPALGASPYGGASSAPFSSPAAAGWGKKTGADVIRASQGDQKFNSHTGVWTDPAEAASGDVSWPSRSGRTAAAPPTGPTTKTLRSVIAKTQSRVRLIHSGFTIDAALKDRLQALSLENAKQVLEKLVDRVQRTDVRNPKAYLMTLMNDGVKFRGGGYSGGGGSGGGGSGGGGGGRGGGRSDICMDFKRGLCHRGNKCLFAHN
jgi:hypothetical protein